MKINKVKASANGFLVNDKTEVFVTDAALIYEISQWQDAGGVIEPMYSDAEKLAIKSQAAIGEVKHALQAHIDAVAVTYGFSNGNSLILYAGFVNPFQTLAQAFGAWESNIWAQADNYKAQVKAGTAPMMSPTEAVAQVTEFKVG